MQSSDPCLVAVPELLTLVAHELDSKSRCRLMRVSKSFFHHVGPIIWKRVPKLELVMNLIKGTRVEHGSIPTSRITIQYPQITIWLPSKPDLRRYHVYSPWVQELELSALVQLRVENLDGFIAQLDGHLPLPNLQSLTTRTDLPLVSQETVKLIDTFASPSLVEIRTIIPRRRACIDRASTSRLPLALVPALLKKIKETCPRIRALEFYPEVARESNGSEQYTSSDQFHSIMSSFLHLRSSSSNTYILEPATLGILGELPYLESLGIRGFPTSSPVPSETICIPNSWFPSLKDLRLYEVHPGHVQALWNQPNIVEKLSSVLMYLDKLHTRDSAEEKLYGAEWMALFLDSLPGLSPHLRDTNVFIWDKTEVPQVLRKYFRHVVICWVYQRTPGISSSDHK